MSDIDPLGALASVPEIADVAFAARGAIDEILWRRDVRASAAQVAGVSRVRGAQASAAIDGADIALVESSPMGRVLEAAARLTDAVPGQVEVFERSPMQAWAHLHALTAHGFADDADLGRPRSTAAADDPLRLGDPLPADEIGERLASLARVLTQPTSAPAVFVAAIAHAEIATIRPFAWGSGLIARASVRLVLAARGVDPSLFTIPEHGFAELGRPAYVRALRAYATGTIEGVTRFATWHGEALVVGARAVVVPS